MYLGTIERVYLLLSDYEGSICHHGQRGRKGDQEAGLELLRPEDLKKSQSSVRVPLFVLELSRVRSELKLSYCVKRCLNQLEK